MQFFHVGAVFTASVFLTTAKPLPEEYLFSDLSDLSNLSDFPDLSSNLYDPNSAADLSFPLADSSLLDGSDDGTSLFTQDLSIAMATSVLHPMAQRVNGITRNAVLRHRTTHPSMSHGSLIC